MKNRSYVLVFLTLVVGGVVLGSFIQGKEITELQPSLAASEGDVVLRDQTAGKRIWKPQPTRRLFTLGGGEQPLFYGPLRLKVDPAGHLFVIDYGDFQIKEVTEKGELVRTYGRGKGQGPGEFTTLNDVVVSDGKTVRVADYSNGRVTTFDREGQLVGTLRLNPQPYRMALFPDESFAMMQPPGSRELFGLFTRDGQLTKTFGRFLDDQAASSLVLDGWLESLPGGGFVYAGMHTSLLAAYDKEGRSRFAVRTIDPQPLPKIEKNSKGVKWVDREAIPVVLSLSVTGDSLHVLSSYPSGLKHIGTIDTYSLADGSYLYSRKVPENCQWVSVSGSHLYTVAETTVSQWAL